MSKRALQLTATIVVAVAGGAVAPSAASATTPARTQAAAMPQSIWKFPSSKWTPLLTGVPGLPSDDDRCSYRVFYSNLGDVPYAKLRFYGGDCAVYEIYVVGVSNRRRALWKASGRVKTGRDNCGSYMERQATGPRGYVVGGAKVFAGSRYAYEFTTTGGYNRIPSSQIEAHC